MLIVIMSSCTPPTQPVVDDSAEQADTQDDDSQRDDAPELWQPTPLHVYTFAASLPREEWNDETARDIWQFSESDYHDMLRRVRATIDSHNRNNPGDELQVIAGGL